MLSFEIPKLPTAPPMRRFPGVWKLLFPSQFPPQDGSLSLFCLSFCLLYFVLPPFKENGLLFCGLNVLWQCSEVVLWKLHSIQTTFWWICGGEIGLPILFLTILGPAPHSSILAWRIPRTEESGRQQSLSPQWVGYDWTTNTCTSTWHLSSSSSTNYFHFILKNSLFVKIFRSHTGGHRNKFYAQPFLPLCLKISQTNRFNWPTPHKLSWQF